MTLRQTESKHVIVGKRDFYIKPFPAMKSANLSGELASMLTPLLAALLPFAKETEEGIDSLMDIKVEEAIPEISKVFENLSGDKLELLLRKLLITSKNIVVEIESESTGEPEQTILNEDLLNELFCGEVQDMFLLAFEVIRLNFNGFFKKLGILFGKAGEAAKMARKIY